MAGGVNDTDRGARELTKRLRDLAKDRAVRLTAGIHADASAVPHPSGNTVGEVAFFTELGTNKQAPVGFVRTTVDGDRAGLAARIAEAGRRVLRGETIGDAFGPVVRGLADRMRARAPVDTGTMRDHIEGRVNGAKA